MFADAASEDSPAADRAPELLELLEHLAKLLLDEADALPEKLALELLPEEPRDENDRAFCLFWV